MYYDKKYEIQGIFPGKPKCKTSGKCSHKWELTNTNRDFKEFRCEDGLDLAGSERIKQILLVTTNLRVIKAGSFFITLAIKQRMTIKFANSSWCAFRRNRGQKPQHGSMTLAYHQLTPVLLLIYGSFFLSSVYYLTVF
jgi:hypothetical protein